MNLVCILLSVLSLVILYFALTYIFFGKQSGETDMSVISRQLRGFALWMIAGSVSMTMVYYCRQDLLLDK
jgi:hypothetical protein